MALVGPVIPPDLFKLLVCSIVISQYVFRRYEPTLYSAWLTFLSGQVVLHVIYYVRHSTAMPLLTWIAVNAVYALGLTSAILLYRISPLHPLSSYPGPLVRRLSKMCALPSAWIGTTHEDLLKYHRMYGRYVRIGPNELSITDAAAVPIIYGHHGWKKGESYAIFSRVKGGVDSVQDTRDEAEHARRRKTWDKALTTTALASYQERVRARARQLCELIASARGEAVDLSLYAKYFTWDVIFDLGFGGHGFNMLEKGHEELPFIKSLAAYIRLIKTAGNVPELAGLLKALPGDADVEMFIKRVAGIFYSKLEEGVSSADLFSHIISPIQPSNSASENERLVAEALSDCILFVGAGSDTTSSAVANTLFLLVSENKGENAIYKRLQRELDNAFEDGDELDSTVLIQKVPLLAAVINESMRLLPPVSTGPFQRLSPAGGAIVAGHFIPENTKVIIPPYAIHHDPEYFPRPDSFQPDRWMPDAPEEIRIRDPNAYRPYNCVGKQLALMELHLAVAALVHRFDAKFAEGFDPDAFLNGERDAVTRQLTVPLKMRFSLRGLDN
ncbi:cytochrome P450 [Gloeophyllum trabeum ATCC 11539]|uniref:Cytochrome P450 n=1 Tax=Gloeophyllum trabeum (strain ATCC 11539 / FP-39264 / Madison 617) TaxID=670483 RepID=S7RF53_GLOTA|nr:cytochrome P450 [Gloeophyllum trabeum ATCC 11539]EPQ52855.1 cytochrome P450 [Gloeophyllum trabeum ATCC 11539]